MSFKAIILLIMGVLLLIRLIRHRWKRAMWKDPNQAMPILADEAVKYAGSIGVTLDYSPESIQQVDNVLGQIHQRQMDGQVDDRELNMHAFQFGAYVGEIIRRQHDGQWVMNADKPDPGNIIMRWKDHMSFPITWCGKRILNGESDSVWFKYQVLTSQRFSGKPDQS